MSIQIVVSSCLPYLIVARLVLRVQLVLSYMYVCMYILLVILRTMIVCLPRPNPFVVMVIYRGLQTQVPTRVEASFVSQSK